MDSRLPTDWSKASRWTGLGVAREVFYFPSGSERLYGSLYMSPSRVRPFGLVICSSWGIDFDRLQRVIPGLALGMARMGGVSLTFHCPGYGDSSGDAGAGTIEALAAATAAAIREADRRRPGTSWVLAGFLLGASVAAVAAPAADVRQLLFLQPALDPAAYVDLVVRRARTRPLARGDTEDTAFGYPIPKAMLDPGQAAVVRAGLDEFRGRGLAVQFAEPPDPQPVPPDFARASVPGRWRVGQRGCPELLAPALEWLACLVAK
jgi:hypothetical protein